MHKKKFALFLLLALFDLNYTQSAPRHIRYFDMLNVLLKFWWWNIRVSEICFFFFDHKSMFSVYVRIMSGRNCKLKNKAFLALFVKLLMILWRGRPIKTRRNPIFGRSWLIPIVTSAPRPPTQCKCHESFHLWPSTHYLVIVSVKLM